MNITLISGRIGKDAVFRTVGIDIVTNFSVAVSKKYKDIDGNKSERTVWFDCSYWNASEKLLPFLTKGTLLILRGEVDSRLFQDKEKQYKSALTLKVDFLELAGSSVESKNETKPATAENPIKSITSEVVVDGEDLPF